MTLRQEMLAQAESKLDNQLERALEAINAITDDGWVSTMLCRIISSERTAATRTAVIRKFADDAEAEIIAKWNNQGELTDSKGETL